jgi:hypothetical protein
MEDHVHGNEKTRQPPSLFCWISSLCLVCSFSLLVFLFFSDHLDWSEETGISLPLNMTSTGVSPGRSSFQSGSSILSSVLNATLHSSIFTSTLQRQDNVTWGEGNHTLHPVKLLRKAKKSPSLLAKNTWCPAWKHDCKFGTRAEDKNATRFWVRRYLDAEEYFVNRAANMTKCVGAGQSLDQHAMHLTGSSNIVTLGQKRFVADVHPASLLEGWGFPDMAKDYNEASRGRWITRSSIFVENL